MISCTLGDKKYTVDFVTGRALREIDKPIKMYAKIVAISRAVSQGQRPEEEISVCDALDELVRWFCILFRNQFTPDDIYDNYPSDRILTDVVMALTAVQNQTTEVLADFPTKATAEQTRTD